MPSRKSSDSRPASIPPKKAIEILTNLINQARVLPGEHWTSPKRSTWIDTARGALERAFGTPSSLLESFEGSRGFAFNASASDEEMRQLVNASLADEVAVLESAIQQLRWEVDEKTETVTPMAVNQPTISVFISHSGADSELALALIELLRGALGLNATDIRCSSVDGYRLAGGAHTETELRKEVTTARAFVGLLTRTSLASPYVMFELGARWGAQLHMLPLLAGVEPNALREPLSALNALSCDSEAQIHQLVADIGAVLHVASQPTAAFISHVKRLSELSKDQKKKSEARARLEILTPLNNTQVGLRRVVSGSIQPPQSQVQVLVHAEDDRWYLQGPVKVDDSAWSVECRFGNIEKGLGEKYQIVAITGGKVKDAHLSVLPEIGTKSPIVTVRRTS